MSRMTPALGAGLLVVAMVGCGKPATKNEGASPTGSAQAEQRVAVPLDPSAPPPGMKAGGPTAQAATPPAGANDALTLKPEEGKLSIEVPSDVAAGREITAKVMVTPASGYHINQEFPTKLTLEAPAGITLAKAQLTAGGGDKSKGDADALDEKQLAFSVKLTPTSGSHTVSGTFKFAVCDKDSCLPKKEQISIVVAAK